MGQKDIYKYDYRTTTKIEKGNPQDPKLDLICSNYAIKMYVMGWKEVKGYVGLPSKYLLKSERDTREAMMKKRYEDCNWYFELTGLLPHYFNLPGGLGDVIKKYDHVPKIPLQHAYQGS